jgi:hypothetical protein
MKQSSVMGLMARPLFNRPAPREPHRVGFQQLKFKADEALRQKVSAAASSAKMKQAEWLRSAALEKLAREGGAA